MVAPRYRPEAFPEIQEKQMRDQEALLKLIDPSIDEGTLTDAELQARYDAFKKIENRPSSIKTNEIIERAKQILNERVPEIRARFGEDRFNQDAQSIANVIINSGDINSLPQYARDSAKNLSTEFSSGRYTIPGIDTSGDIKRLEGLISERNEKAQKNKQVDDLLTQLPSDLEKQREELLSGETERATERFQSEFVPRALETLNVRGALFSGDVEDLLTSEAFNVQSELNAFQSELEQQDNQFYFDAAYQNKVRQLMETNQNLSSALNFERQNALTGQEQRFLSGQRELDLRLNERLYQNEAERKLRLNEINLRRQQEAQERANRSRLVSGLGSAVGTTVGSLVGAKVGGPVGSQIGANIGGSFGGLGGSVD